ncbi:YtzH-like family protein [Actinomycetes bacterium NPDC127524]|uniref:YtzH-like family protein n=1 Tax=Bacillus sp. OV322 TaxID=1882764 RepID=UPI0008E199B7|nr:YtzH-like family protein [Bacillus sp. OV322]SFC58601.1 YtzH-like protein [Bacillus sp. OV322]
MPLSHEHQVSLLKDILNNHQSDCCGSISECEQVERLVKSLMVNMDVHQNVKNVLEEIYRYSQGGINSGDLDEHITSHKGQLTQWVDDIGEYS